MGIPTTITSLLIALGIAFMVLAITMTGQIMQLLKSSLFSRMWRTLMFMMGFFLVGYLATVALIWGGYEDIVLLLTGFVFFFGAVFVLLVVRLGFLTIKELNEANNALEKEIKQSMINHVTKIDSREPTISLAAGYGE